LSYEEEEDKNAKTHHTLVIEKNVNDDIKVKVEDLNPPLERRYKCKNTSHINYRKGYNDDIKVKVNPLFSLRGEARMQILPFSKR